MFSPVKKQRVPRFDEGSITIGASPAKPEPTDLPGEDLLHMHGAHGLEWGRI